MDETAADVPKGAFRYSFGAPDAPFVVVEFGDFQCPYCARAAPVLRELVETSDGQVRLVFRHFPIYDVHPFALTAALAAEAAGAHGKFWEMHDLLFAHQDMLADYKLKHYADRIGVDGDCVVGDAAQRYGDAVEFDYAQGVELGVRGTPTLFVNGAVYRDRVELSALRKATAPRRARALADAGDGGGDGARDGADSEPGTGGSRGLLQKLRLAPGSRR